jgi:hypothetical protein
MANPARSGATRKLPALLHNPSLEQPMPRFLQMNGMRPELQPAHNEAEFLEASYEDKNVRLSCDQRDSSYLAVLDFECSRAVSHFNPRRCC